MTIFIYENYKTWFNDRLAAMPNRGRGQSSRLAEFLNVSPTIITQVFRGDRDLSAEQALQVAEFMALSRLETRYLIAMVNLARAGSARYRALLREDLAQLKASAREIGTRVAQESALTEGAKNLLYSNWYYLAVWGLVAIGQADSPQAVAARLALSPLKASEAIQLLLETGLIKTDGEGRMRVGTSLIHLGAESPQVARHHQNWRLQAFRKHDQPGGDDAFYTAPITLSTDDARILRERILSFIAEMVDRVAASPSEKLYCFNLDWFEV